MTLRDNRIAIQRVLAEREAAFITVRRKDVLPLLRVARAAEQWNEDPLSIRLNAALRVAVEERS